MAAALRSDLTFLVTARAWFSVNYDTWIDRSFYDAALKRVAASN